MPSHTQHWRVKDSVHSMIKDLLEVCGHTSKMKPVSLSVGFLWPYPVAQVWYGLGREWI